MQKNIILPNMITLLGLLSGVYSMVLASSGKFTLAAIAILIAAVFDGLDGKVARLVKGTSEFGVQLDSLADVVSFGVAPAYLIYHWQFQNSITQFGLNIGIMAMFLYVACGALRLARFNVQTKKISNLFFVGMPIPGAAGILASSVLFVKELNLYDLPYISLFYLVLVFLLAFLMVSTVPYYSFKNLSFLKTRPFNTIVILVIFLFFIGLKPLVTIFAALIIYALSGFILLPLRKRIMDRYDKEAGEI